MALNLAVPFARTLLLRRPCSSLKSVPKLWSRKQFGNEGYRENTRCLCYKSKDSDGVQSREPDKSDVIRFSPSKFTPFKDEDAPIIFDVEEEKLNAPVPEDESDPFSDVNLQRGERGVFDVEDLVMLLRQEKAQDVVVIEVPSSFGYVDHMVIINGKSPKHMMSVAETVRVIFKKKRHPSDKIPAIEGKNNSDWIALDMGNIALHIFSSKARKIYDLETLWAVGPDYDDKLRPPEDSFEALMKKHTVNLGDLQPAEVGG